MSGAYFLNRSEEESKRLEKQHELWTSTLGFYLHPSLAGLLLQPTSRVGELATGTGIWLRELSTSLPATASLTGFDISDAQFPPGGTLPANVELAVLDATAAAAEVPAQWAGRFDVLHIRLLVGALARSADWAAVARTALALLRPGGALQWDEGDFSSESVRMHAAGPDASTAALEEGYRAVVALMGHDDRFRLVRTLADILASAGFERVDRHTVSCGKDPARRADWDEVSVGAYNSIIQKALSAGALGPDWTQHRFDDMVAREMRDLASGAYVTWDLMVFTAWKPNA